MTILDSVIFVIVILSKYLHYNIYKRKSGPVMFHLLNNGSIQLRLEQYFLDLALFGFGIPD